MLGAVVGAFVDVPRPVRATLLAFASGALLTALAFELFEEAHRDAGLVTASLALLAGAATFIVADWLLQRFVGGAGAVGLALVAAVTLDGVPENLALGVTLSHGGSYALLVALIASNFPEALGGAMSIRESGHSPAFAIAAWGATAVLLALALVAGRVLAVGAPEDVVAIALAFAAGAVLASLADTLMPEAYKEGGPLVAFATTAGFLLSYAIASS
jgi:zinc transporter, ZIP family